MTFNRLTELIQSDADSIKNMMQNEVELPYLLENLAVLLSDSGAIRNNVSDGDMVTMAYMFKAYMNCCYTLSDELLTNSKIIDNVEYKAYKILAANGERFATVGEIDNGVEGLFTVPIYPAGELAAKHLRLLYWALTGKSFAFRTAGFTLEYDKLGKVTNSFYQMIQMSYLRIKEMMDWVSSGDNYDTAIKKVKKFISRGKYQYAQYEKDEVQADISVKQLLHSLRINSKKSNKYEYRRAVALSFEAQKGKKITPLQISEMRKAYNEVCAGQTENNINAGVLELCNKLEEGVSNGALPSNHFALKIVKTLKAGGYTWCSEKQRGILIEALNLMEKNSKKEESNPIITDEGMEDFLSSFSSNVDDIFN